MNGKGIIGTFFYNDGYKHTIFMKKIIALFAFGSLAATAATAQLQRGNVLVGGNLAGLDFNLDSGGQLDFNLSPKAAWFIRDGVAVGGYARLGLATAKGAGTNVGYGVGALARYYFNGSQVPTGSSKVRAFVEGTAGIEGFNASVGGSTNGLGLGIGPGIAYFITPNVGLEGLFKYNGIVGFGNAVTTNNLGLEVGFQVYLPSRKVRQISEGKL